MSFRASLKQCVNMMGYQLKVHNYPHLTIIQNPRGKYYTLHSDDELEIYEKLPKNQRPRVVACLTHSELRSFCRAAQISVDLEDAPDD